MLKMKLSDLLARLTWIKWQNLGVDPSCRAAFAAMSFSAQATAVGPPPGMPLGYFPGSQHHTSDPCAQMHSHYGSFGARAHHHHNFGMMPPPPPAHLE